MWLQSEDSRSGAGHRHSAFPLSLWILSAAFIVYGTTIPFHFVADLGLARDKLSRLPLSPLISPGTGRRVSIPDVIQNILLFVPFGICGVAVLTRLRWQVRVVVVALLGAALSVGVETLQLWTLDRTSAVSDVAANATGAAVGGLAVLLLSGPISRGIRWLRRAGIAAVPESYPLAIAAMLVVLASWEPFDVTLEVGSVWSKVKGFVHDPWQTGGPADEGLQLLRYGLLAWVGSAWLRAHGVGRSAGLAVLLCGALGAALESTQLLIGSRQPGLQDAAVALAGACLGAALFAVGSRRTRPIGWYVFLVSATLGGALLQMLSPFVPSGHHESFRWIPFGGYTDASPQTISQTFELMLIGFPLGFALPYLFAKQRQPFLIATVVATAVAFPVEYLQGWITGRVPDVTDVLFVVSGAVVGVWTGVAGRRRFQKSVRRP